jgi:putative ABC transport system permease protein
MLSLLRLDTIFTDVTTLGLPQDLTVIILGTVAVLLTSGLLYSFLQTEMGMTLRATGDNEQMIRSLGVNTNSTKIMGLAVGNGLVALSGAMVAQYQSYADVGMGIGMIVVGLASVIVGEVVLGTKSLRRTLMAVILGSIIYRAVIALVMRLGLPTTDLKLFTALLVVLALSAPSIKAKILVMSPKGKGRGQHAVHAKS